MVGPDLVLFGETLSALCNDGIKLVSPSRYDVQAIAGQWPLQSGGLVPRPVHPNVPFFLSGQNHRNCLGVYRNDRCIRFCRQKSVKKVATLNRVGLRPSNAGQFRPYSRKGKQGAVRCECEPDYVLPAGLKRSANADLHLWSRYLAAPKDYHCLQSIFLPYAADWPRCLVPHTNSPDHYFSDHRTAVPSASGTGRRIAR
ncbi:hypothetical protein RPYSC3_25600 [Rhodopseudomonas palustris]|nr:hypothetical protein RPYSC3_25600 [Rhodopseudomonas palustris]